MTSLPQSIILAEADLANSQKALDDLLNSDTARAQAVIALRDAQEVYDRAFNWRRELDNDRITVKEIVYKKRFGITIPEVKEYKTWADEATKTKAQRVSRKIPPELARRSKTTYVAPKGKRRLSGETQP